MVLLLTGFFPFSFSCIFYRLAGSEEEEEEGQWQLYFKLYCFLDIENVPKDGVEFAFMFEQVSKLWENDLVSRMAKAHRGYRKLVYLSLEVGILVVAKEFSALDFCLESAKQIDHEIF